MILNKIVNKYEKIERLVKRSEIVTNLENSKFLNAEEKKEAIQMVQHSRKELRKE